MCHPHWRDGESWNQKAEVLHPRTHDLNSAVATVPIQECLTVQLVFFPLQSVAVPWAALDGKTQRLRPQVQNISVVQHGAKRKGCSCPLLFPEILTSWKLVFKNPLFLVISKYNKKSHHELLSFEAFIWSLKYFVAATNISDSWGSWGKEGFVPAHSSVVHYSRDVLALGVSCDWSHCINSQEAECNECLWSADFLQFVKPRTPACGVVQLIFRVGLPTSAGQAQRPISWLF